MFTIIKEAERKVKFEDINLGEYFTIHPEGKCPISGMYYLYRKESDDVCTVVLFTPEGCLEGFNMFPNAKRGVPSIVATHGNNKLKRVKFNPHSGNAGKCHIVLVAVD